MSILSLILFCVTVFVVTNAQENDQQSQATHLTPQIYIKDSSGLQPVKPNEFGVQNQPSTTVCVEIRGNPFAVCGSPIPSGGVQHAQPINPNHPIIKETKFPIPSPTNQHPIAQLPSEIRPVIAYKGGLGIPIPQPIPLPINPLFLQPLTPSSLAAINPAALNAASYMYQKQYLNGLHQGSYITDGSLSMNCRVGGVKYNQPESRNSYNSNSNIGYRLPQPMITGYSQNSQRYPSQFVEQHYPLWNSETNSFYNFQEPGSVSVDMKGRDAISNNEMTVDNLDVTDPNKIAEDNKRKLIELKQQIASLQDMSQGLYAQKAVSQPEVQQNTTPNQQSTQQNSSPSSSQISGEPKPSNKSPNQRSAHQRKPSSQ